MCLAWMLVKWPNVVPIPGSKNQGRILENLDAADAELTEAELAELDAALCSHEVAEPRRAAAVTSEAFDVVRWVMGE